MNKVYLPLLWLFCSLSLMAQQAQTPVKTSVYFDTDKSELTAEARQVLDELAPVLLQAGDYQLELEAFTDDRGTNSYNRELAAARAAAVQNYLEQKGLTAQKAGVKNWGEEKSWNTSDLGRQNNRRVDVAITSFLFDNFWDLRERLGANTEQVFPVNTGQEQTITAAKGTLVVVPAHAFVFEDGTAPTGNVDLLIQEAYDPAAFIMHNLTTTSDGQILQTGGMVSVTAQSEGKPLRLADGMELTVAIPNGGNFDPQMELFYAQPVSTGGVNWKPAGQKFRRTLKPSRAELNIDPELGKRIAAIKVAEYPKPDYPAFKGQMPLAPKAPVAPYKPRAPKKPVWEEVQKIFATSGNVEKMSKKATKRAQVYYQEQSERYTRDSAKYVQLLERYEVNMSGFEKAKVRYIEDHRAWEAELRARLAAIAMYQRELRVHYYSRALAKALKTQAKNIQKYPVYSNLYWGLDDAASEEMQMMMVMAGFSSNTKKDVKIQGNLYESLIGVKVIDQYQGYQRMNSQVYQSLSSDTTSRVMSRLLASTGLRPLSDSLQMELKERNLLNAESPKAQSSMLSSYVASVGQLGWINCDRFYNDPAPKMEVMVAEQEDASLYAICSDIKAMLPFNRMANGQYVAKGLPKGKKITIVAIKIENGVAHYSQKDMRVGEQTPSLVYQPMPLKDLKAELRKLSI
ncbi:MAG: OmpA family protein [Saprospiraceae bacterium]|nr:OmpA family protein [Saprospiraceae bacterium]